MWSVGGEPGAVPDWTLDPVPPASFDDRQHVAGVHRRAWDRRYLFHHSLFWRLDFVLHLHGFDYDDTLSGLDLGILRNQHAHYASWHGRHDLPGTLLGAGSFLTRAQRARIAQLDDEAGAAHPQMEIGGSLLALNFVGVPIDQKRQNVAARNPPVKVTRFPVQTALPSAGGSFKLQPVWLTVHHHFINHKDQRSASER